MNFDIIQRDLFTYEKIVSDLLFCFCVIGVCYICISGGIRSFISWQVYHNIYVLLLFSSALLFFYYYLLVIPST